MDARLAQVRRRHHRAERLLDRSPRVRQEPGDASERLVLFGVEHVEDCAHQQRMTGLFPMIALLEASFGIDRKRACRERVCQYVSIVVGAGSLNKKYNKNEYGSVPNIH